MTLFPLLWDPNSVEPLSKALIALIGIVGTVAGFYRWVRPRLKQIAHDMESARDSIVGRDAVHDTITGIELAPALPGIGVRMATTEKQMDVLTDAVAKLADSSTRLDDHDERIKRLEHGAAERIVARAESTAAWRAVEAIAGTVPSEAHDDN